MSATLLRSVLIATALACLCACSQSSQQPAPNRQQQAQAQRNQEDLELYQQLRSKGSYELAAPIGEGLLKRAPDSPQAARVRQTLADTRARGDKINEQRRLEQLWLYQSGEESGGRQNTATIKPTRPAEDHGRIRLILRRHSDWGQSVYLYDGANQGFVCKGGCKLPLKVDGKAAKPLKASLPDTRDPAMFIDHDKRFLKLLDSAKTLEITADIKGQGKRDLYFETSGFKPERWPEPGKN